MRKNLVRNQLHYFMTETKKSFTQRDWLHGREDNQRYVNRMDAHPHEKNSVIETYLSDLSPESLIFSVGAGSGQLEKFVAELTDATVFASDKSLAMLGIIAEKAKTLTRGRLIPLASEGEKLPLAQGAADVILCFSVIHEVASFEHKFEFAQLKEFFADMLLRLKPGGRVIIRDFMQPENPNEIVTVRLGTPHISGNPPQLENDPREFLQYFIEHFKGDNLESLRQQILAHQTAGTWEPGATLQMSRAVATEVLAHASWQSSKEEEVKEKYAYLPAQEYANFIVQAGQEIGVQARVIQASSTVLPGYRQNIQGRFDIIDTETQAVQDIPPWTGVVVIERLANSVAEESKVTQPEIASDEQ